MPETTIWYTLQYSERGANDWYTTNTTEDSLKPASYSLEAKQMECPSYDWRIVEVQLTETPVDPVEAA